MYFIAYRRRFIPLALTVTLSSLAQQVCIKAVCFDLGKSLLWARLVGRYPQRILNAVLHGPVICELIIFLKEKVHCQNKLTDN